MFPPLTMIFQCPPSQAKPLFKRGCHLPFCVGKAEPRGGDGHFPTQFPGNDKCSPDYDLIWFKVSEVGLSLDAFQGNRLLDYVCRWAEWRIVRGWNGSLADSQLHDGLYQVYHQEREVYRPNS